MGAESPLKLHPFNGRTGRNSDGVPVGKRPPAGPSAPNAKPSSLPPTHARTVRRSSARGRRSRCRGNVEENSPGSSRLVKPAWLRVPETPPRLWRQLGNLATRPKAGKPTNAAAAAVSFLGAVCRRRPTPLESAIRRAGRHRSLWAIKHVVKATCNYQLLL